MFWFRQVVELTPDLASQAWIAVNLPEFGVWFAYALVGVAGILAVIGGACFALRWRRSPEDEELLS